MTATRATVGAVAMAALLVLAGCASPIGTGTDGPAGDAVAPDGGTTLSGDGGTVTFYVSDERNAIDEFEHLNVTITKVGFHRAGEDGSDDADDDESDAPEDGDEPETEEPTETVEPSETAGNGTEATGTPTATEAEDAAEGEESERDESDGDGSGDWVEYEVNRTVDLTRLLGANATKLGALQAPNGSYDKVFVYVDGIDATLEGGEQVNVKLPSSKLQLNKGFTVGDGENVSFVYDVSVFKAGNSGKYILKPVVSQSGTSEEVDIEDVDERGDREGERPDDASDGEETPDDAENGTDDDGAEGAAALSAEFQGPVEAGSNATLKVTGDAGPVANATVAVDGERVGTTDEAGAITFAVPADAEELEVTVEAGDAEVELERDLSGDGNGAGEGNASLALLG